MTDRASKIALGIGIIGIAVFMGGLAVRSFAADAVAEAHGYVCGYVAGANSFLAADGRSTVTMPDHCGDLIKRVRRRGLDFDQDQRDI